MEFILFVAVGMGVGILAGLFGVGGGLVIVPVLAASYVHYGEVVPVMQLAIGTSLASIVFTSLSSIYAHHKKQAVVWSWWWALLPGIVLGGVIGAVLVSQVSSVFLARFFALFEVAVGIKIWFAVQQKGHSKQAPSGIFKLCSGLVIAGVSAVVGIGGGTLSVPFLLWQQIPMAKAVATSSAIGLPLALFSSIGFVALGWSQQGLPAFSLGYVDIQALLPLVLGSVLCAPLGVKLAHNMSPVLLQKLFALLLIGLGIKMWFQF